jgi:small subunit ribosomal protein S7
MGQLKKKGIEPDPRYNNLVVSRFTNYLMKGGKKNTARRIIYGAFDIIQDKTKKEPVEIFEQAIQNASPILEVRSKRIGGAKYQVPVEVSKDRRVALAMRWIIGAASKGKGQMKQRLAKEFIEAASNTGEAIRKKDNVHKMAEANKAFAHFAW